MIKEINEGEKTDLPYKISNNLCRYSKGLIYPSFEHGLDLVTYEEQSIEGRGTLIVKKPSKHHLGQMTQG